MTFCVSKFLLFGGGALFLSVEGFRGKRAHLGKTSNNNGAAKRGEEKPKNSSFEQKQINDPRSGIKIADKVQNLLVQEPFPIKDQVPGAPHLLNEKKRQGMMKRRGGESLLKDERVVFVEESSNNHLNLNLLPFPRKQMSQIIQSLIYIAENQNDNERSRTNYWASTFVGDNDIFTKYKVPSMNDRKTIDTFLKTSLKTKLQQRETGGVKKNSSEVYSNNLLEQRKRLEELTDELSKIQWFDIEAVKNKEGEIEIEKKRLRDIKRVEDVERLEEFRLKLGEKIKLAAKKNQLDQRQIDIVTAWTGINASTLMIPRSSNDTTGGNTTGGSSVGHGIMKNSVGNGIMKKTSTKRNHAEEGAKLELERRDKSAPIQNKFSELEQDLEDVLLEEDLSADDLNIAKILQNFEETCQQMMEEEDFTTEDMEKLWNDIWEDWDNRKKNEEWEKELLLTSEGNTDQNADRNTTHHVLSSGILSGNGAADVMDEEEYLKCLLQGNYTADGRLIVDDSGQDADNGMHREENNYIDDDNALRMAIEESMKEAEREREEKTGFNKQVKTLKKQSYQDAIKKGEIIRIDGSKNSKKGSRNGSGSQKNSSDSSQHGGSASLSEPNNGTEHVAGNPISFLKRKGMTTSDDHGGEQLFALTETSLQRKELIDKAASSIDNLDNAAERRTLEILKESKISHGVQFHREDEVRRDIVDQIEAKLRDVIEEIRGNEFFEFFEEIRGSDVYLPDNLVDLFVEESSERPNILEFYVMSKDHFLIKEGIPIPTYTGGENQVYTYTKSDRENEENKVDKEMIPFIEQLQREYDEQKQLEALEAANDGVPATTDDSSSASLRSSEEASLRSLRSSEGTPKTHSTSVSGNSGATGKSGKSTTIETDRTTPSSKASSTSYNMATDHVHATQEGATIPYDVSESTIQNPYLVNDHYANHNMPLLERGEDHNEYGGLDDYNPEFGDWDLTVKGKHHQDLINDLGQKGIDLLSDIDLRPWYLAHELNLIRSKPNSGGGSSYPPSSGTSRSIPSDLPSSPISIREDVIVRSGIVGSGSGSGRIGSSSGSGSNGGITGSSSGSGSNSGKISKRKKGKK